MTRTAVLGRQEIFFTKADFDYVKRRLNWDADYDSSLSPGQFCEPLLHKCGAQQIETFDASDYEGASIIADFNCPVDAALRGRFTAFLDFGSIEHIFNVASAVQNVADLLELGGKALILTQANGFAGHGFYQFSPEFFYTVFSVANGFSDTVVFMIDLSRIDRWYFVPDPAVLGERVVVPPSRPYYVICVTTKQRDVAALNAQQSDYQTAWTVKGHKHSRASSRALQWVKGIIGPVVAERAKYKYAAHKSDRKFLDQTSQFDPEAISPEQFSRLASHRKP